MGVYNDVERVERAVMSILAQTYEDLELIVIDDGSIDGSGPLLDRIAASDARVRVMHQENTGLTKALIRGCLEARGDFIARQDADDWSHPHRIAEQVARLVEDPGLGFVSCATQYVGPNGEPLTIVSRSADSATATRGLLENRLGPPAHGSVMFRREIYHRAGGYRPQFYFAQDADLWLRMAEVARVAYLPEVRYAFLRETESTSGLNRPVQRQFGELAELCRKTRSAGGDESAILARAQLIADSIRTGNRSRVADRRALADAAYFIGAQLTANRDPRARPYLVQTIRLRPWHWRAWVRLIQTLGMRPVLDSRTIR
jgi:glycosyltransferase involved in cell wall biosynthesis